MIDQRIAAASFWDRQAQSPADTMYWAEYPVVRNYVNNCATDAWWAYPAHGFKAGWAYEPLRRGLSIGCGTGSLEKAIRWLRICEEVDAYDISPESIRVAEENAQRDQIDRVRYRVGDCESLEYPPAHYDAVFFNGSLHHIFDPDRLLERLEGTLSEGGLVYVDEYVGPSRDEWREEHLLHARRVWDTLPDSVKGPDPISIPFDGSDPSEMIRSSRILPALHARFEILWERPYWGNLLYPILCRVRHEEMKKSEYEPLLRDLIAEEQSLTRDGAFRNPLFVWVVARKRS